MMMERVTQPGGESMLPLDIHYWQRFVMRFNETASAQGVDVPVLLTTPHLRPLLSSSLNKVMGRVAVISVGEVPSDMAVRTLASLSLHDAG